MNSVTLTFPFTILPTGQVATTTDYQEQWADRVISLVGTHFGERPFRPDIGSALGSTSFENFDDVEETAVETVQAAFTKYLPFLSLTDVLVSQEFNEEGASLVNIEIEYILPNGDEQATVVTYGTLDTTGEFYDDMEQYPLLANTQTDDIDEAAP